MSFCRTIIRFCFFVTNHGLEITLFLLYIVNLSLMSTTALIYSLSKKNSNIAFCFKGIPGHWEKKYHYFAIRLKQTHVASCRILLTFFPPFFLMQGNSTDARSFFHSSVWDFRSSWLCVCQVVWKTDDDFPFSPDKWAPTSFLLVKKVKITSSIQSRLPSLRVCVTAWCGCELYCMYICAFIHVGVCVCIYVCVIYAHVIYTLWYIHTPLWRQQILYCFGTKYTTNRGLFVTYLE